MPSTSSFPFVQNAFTMPQSDGVQLIIMALSLGGERGWRNRNRAEKRECVDKESYDTLYVIQMLTETHRARL